MAYSVVHRNASREGNASFDLLLHIFVHVASLSEYKKQHNPLISMAQIFQQKVIKFQCQQEKVTHGVFLKAIN